jgi:hypothetical protein
MAEAARDNTIDFGSPEWLPINDAFARFRDNWGSRDPAAVALYQALVDGRLASGLALFRRTAPRAAGQHVSPLPTGQPEHHVLPPKFWRQFSLTAASDGNGVLCEPAKGFKSPAGWDAGYFFVRRSDLDAIFAPAASAMPEPTIGAATPEPALNKKALAQQLIQELYERPPHEIRKEEAKTGTVRAKVNAELMKRDKNAERFGWDTINRALGRDLRRKT